MDDHRAATRINGRVLKLPGARLQKLCSGLTKSAQQSVTDHYKEGFPDRRLPRRRKGEKLPSVVHLLDCSPLVGRVET